jgi:predicted transcriptional regulator
MPAKTIVSTALDEDVLKRLDSLCSEIHRTRAEVLRGLLYSLLQPEKYFIIDEWREVAKINAGTPA